MRKVVGALLLVLALCAVGGASAEDEDFLISKGELKALGAAFPEVRQFTAAGVGPGSVSKKSCVTTGEPGSVPGVDKDISCDSPFGPDNELAIASDPAHPERLLAGSNDYQLNFVGNTAVVQVPSGYFFSVDSGRTWVDGQLPMKGSLGGGDPVPEFNDKYNMAVFASLSFVCGQGAPVCSRGNVEFASAKLDNYQPGTTLQWSDQEIANGRGSDNAEQQIFLDKEWMAVDNHATKPNGQANPYYGNMYVFFARYRTEHGAYDESPIWYTMSSDGGRRWTLPTEVSGRNPTYCKWQDDADDETDANGPSSSQGNAEGPDDPNACDQDSFPIPVVAPDGTLYVHFQNEQNLLAYEQPQRYDSQLMLIKSSDGGRTFRGEAPTAQNQAGCVLVEGGAPGTPAPGFANPCIVPLHIVNLEDSYDTHGEPLNEDQEATVIPDYPLNDDGRITLTGHEFRVNSEGNLAVGPNPASPLGYRLWVTFSDNCRGVRPGNGLPIVGHGAPAITETDVYYAYSDDGGVTWAGGDQLGVSCVGRLDLTPDAGADQWFPWSGVDPHTGTLHVGYMDGSWNGVPSRDTYGYSLTSVPLSGTPTAESPLSGALSRPDESLFFQTECPDSEDDTCSSFIGDYNGLAVDALGRIHGVWTDMRRGFPDPTTGLAPQDAYYAQRPVTP